MIHLKNKKLLQAFTIVELVIVITVIGILASISVVGYGSWRTSIAQSEVKNDLKGITAAMESARNFGSGYPTTLPSSFAASTNVTLTYASGDTTKYCINGVSKVNSAVKFYVDSTTGKEPKTGACTPVIAGAPTVSGSLNAASVSLYWSSVSGATSYEVQWRQNSGTWTTVTTASLSFSQTGRAIGTTYDYQVRAVNSGNQSAWSSMKTYTPFAGPASISGCGGQGIQQVSWPSAANSQIPTFYVYDYNSDEFVLDNPLTATGNFTWNGDDTANSGMVADLNSITVQYANTQGWLSYATSMSFGATYPCNGS